jgi:DNA-binding XRE family transcriptional regulator
MADQNNWSVVSNKKTQPKSTSQSTPVAMSTASSVPPKPQVPSYWPETVVLRKDLPPPTVKMAKMATTNSNRSLEVSQHQRRIEMDADEGIVKKKVYTDAFRQKLKETRQQMGNLTQQQFAKLFSVTESLIKGIENGTAVYDPTVVTKITNLINQMNQKAMRAKKETDKASEAGKVAEVAKSTPANGSKVSRRSVFNGANSE